MVACATMTRLDYADRTADKDGWARELGISREALDLYLACEVVDLHVDTFLWHRILRYDLCARHPLGWNRAFYFGQVDLPRIREARIAGAIWVITTNPLRRASRRPEVLVDNFHALRAELARAPDDVAFVRNVAEYRAARAAGKHAAFIGIQGGNALDRDAGALDLIPDDGVVRITLVHLSSSRIGVTSSPLKLGAQAGLTDFGRDYVRRMNDKRILVDLAHIDRKGFFDALEVHDRSQPVLATHTGVSGVLPHWRNLDDEQVRAVADLGGTVGIIYQDQFLGGTMCSGKLAAIVDHLEHVVELVGDDHASLGSDWDGMIVAPRDMPTCLELPRIVQAMLDRNWSPDRVRKVLGGNALRTIEAVRG